MSTDRETDYRGFTPLQPVYNKLQTLCEVRCILVWRLDYFNSLSIVQTRNIHTNK